ncbi:hypothetical protein [Bremerella cremea]|uniref:hypothetical protein n=1 Tax=Bremerella cremea TaxID=1031537 RepID=UPI0031EAC6A3
MLYGGSPGQYRDVPAFDKRAWLSNWPESYARRQLLTPAEATTPDGIYQQILAATGQEDVARAARLEALTQAKLRSLAR